jgi:hypothetical protein
MAVRVTAHNAVLMTAGVTSFARVTAHVAVLLAAGVSMAKVTMHCAVILCQRPTATGIRFRAQVIG